MFGANELSDQSAGQWETGTGETTYSVEEANSSPHLSFAAILLLLIGLKAFTESNLISTDLAEIKLSLLNIVTIGTVSVAFIIGFKVFTAWAKGRGLALPGQEELAKAI